MKRENLNLLMKSNATISLEHAAFSAVRRVANTVWTFSRSSFAANTASSLLGHDAASLTHADLWIFFSEDPFKLCQLGWRLLLGSHFQDSLELCGLGFMSELWLEVPGVSISLSSSETLHTQVCVSQHDQDNSIFQPSNWQNCAPFQKHPFCWIPWTSILLVHYNLVACRVLSRAVIKQPIMYTSKHLPTLRFYRL